MLSLFHSFTKMNSLDATIVPSMDDFLDFSSDLDDNDDLDNHNHHHRCPSLDPDNRFLSLPAEEELEWLSNKDAFPGIETSIDVFSDQIPMTGAGMLKQHSPVSVLDSITTTSSGGSGITGSFSGVVNVNPPRKARSKAHRRVRSHLLIPGQQCWLSPENLKKSNKVKLAGVTIGRKCQHCGVEKTPQWRAGPLGAKTLCNACGVRYKSGRLVPEYRPANSPTFSMELHSNSHRKVLEMRRQKQMMGLPVEKPTEKG